jgi:two-component system chemotaxis response regulator CheB
MPILIVQHIADGFLPGMVEWLQKSTKLRVKIAEDGEYMEKGTVYFCPSEFNIGINKALRVELDDEATPYSVKPSVSYMFRTVCKHMKNRAIGILLTGMGKDGAEELARMKETGALTIVQDRESSVVYGMPGEAIAVGAHKYILPPEDIAKKLIEVNNHIIQKQ